MKRDVNIKEISIFPKLIENARLLTHYEMSKNHGCNNQ